MRPKPNAAGIVPDEQVVLRASEPTFRPDNDRQGANVALINWPVNGPVSTGQDQRMIRCRQRIDEFLKDDRLTDFEQMRPTALPCRFDGRHAAPLFKTTRARINNRSLGHDRLPPAHSDLAELIDKPFRTLTFGNRRSNREQHALRRHVTRVGNLHRQRARLDTTDHARGNRARTIEEFDRLTGAQTFDLTPIACFVPADRDLPGITMQIDQIGEVYPVHGRSRVGLIGTIARPKVGMETARHRQVALSERVSSSIILRNICSFGPAYGTGL